MRGRESSTPLPLSSADRQSCRRLRGCPMRFRSLASLCFVPCCLALALPAAALAEEPAAKISFDKQIRPIFQANCQGCHQPAKAGGEYVMTTFDRLTKGGESGDAAIAPGKPDESEILKQVSPGADG